MAEKTEQQQNNNNMKKSVFRDYFESLVVAIILALIIKTFVLQTFQIPTGSMEDGLLVGDHIIANKMVYRSEMPILRAIFPMRDIRRGDVVLFKYPPEPTMDYIKRVIGLPGETVRIYQHQVYIDGVEIEELGLDEDSYTLEWRNADVERSLAINSAAGSYRPETDADGKVPLEFKVPENHYFMLGDHRHISRDSRYWGTVPRDHITARGVMIYWSSQNDRADYRETNLFKQVANTFVGVISFPFKTRWTRLFNLIS